MDKASKNRLLIWAGLSPLAPEVHALVQAARLVIMDSGFVATEENEFDQSTVSNKFLDCLRLAVEKFPPEE